VILGGKEHWFHSEPELEKFREEQKQRLERMGRDLVVADTAEQPPQDGASTPVEEDAAYSEQELHEVRGLNRSLIKMAEFGLAANDLIRLERIAGREPPVRYLLENGDSKRPLPHLRDLPTDIRRLGERGLTVTRFKGLGEMDAEELWATTLDPQVRTLL